MPTQREILEDDLGDDYDSYFEADDGGRRGLPDSFDPFAGDDPVNYSVQLSAEVQAANQEIKEAIFDDAIVFFAKWRQVVEKWEAWGRCMVKRRRAPFDEDLIYTFACGANYGINCHPIAAITDYGLYNYFPAKGVSGRELQTTPRTIYDDHAGTVASNTDNLYYFFNAEGGGPYYNTFNYQYGGHPMFEYGKLPWARFTYDFGIHFNRMKFKMENVTHENIDGAMPSDSEILRIKAENVIDDQQAFAELIFRKNHNEDVKSMLRFGYPHEMRGLNSNGSLADQSNNNKGSMHPNGTAGHMANNSHNAPTGHNGCPAFELIADPFYSGFPDDLTQTNSGYAVKKYHASILWNGWLDNLRNATYTPTVTRTPGRGCGGALQMIARKSLGGNGVNDPGMYKNRPNANPGVGRMTQTNWHNPSVETTTASDFGWDDYGPDYILNWNAYPGPLDSCIMHLKDTPTLPGFTNVSGEHGDGRPGNWSTAGVASSMSLLGMTFYRGSFLQPEIMYWWNQSVSTGEEGSSYITEDTLRHWAGVLPLNYSNTAYYSPAFRNRGDMYSQETDGTNYYYVNFRQIITKGGDSLAFSWYCQPGVLHFLPMDLPDQPGEPRQPGVVGAPRTSYAEMWKSQFDQVMEYSFSGNAGFGTAPSNSGGGHWQQHGKHITIRHAMRGEGNCYAGDSNKGPGYGRLIGPSDWEELRDCYFELKQACIELRIISSKILQLDVKKFVAQQTQRAVLNFYLDDSQNDALTPEQRAQLEGMLEELEGSIRDNEIMTNTSDFARTIIFKEQCFLLANILPISQWYKNNSNLPLPYKENTENAPIFIDGESYGFFNKLTTGDSDLAYLSATESELSQIQPMISLYKVEYNQDDDTETEVKINFDSFANVSNLSDMLTNRERRGFGVGIKSFDFKYAGSNPFSARRSIQAKLVIFANSFDELLMSRTSTDPTDKQFRYVDLALKTRSPSAQGSTDPCRNIDVSSIENTNMAKLNFRLKAVVGWAAPPGHTSMREAFKTALYDSFVTLNLTPTVHSFDFDEMGRVTFEIDYLAYVDDFMEQNLFSIFADTDIIQKQILRELTYRHYRRECMADSIETLKDLAKDEVIEEKRTSVANLIGGLIEQDKIYHIVMSYDEIRNFSADGPFLDPPPTSAQLTPRTSEQKLNELSANISTALDQYFTRNPDEDSSSARSQMQASLTVNNPNQADVPFFYAGDLINLIMGRISSMHRNLSVAWRSARPPLTRPFSGYEIAPGVSPTINACDYVLKLEEITRCAAEYEKFRVVLGPVELVNRKNDSDSRMVNLADLPISTKYFIEFLTEKLAQKEQAEYNLSSFLNDFFNGLLRNFMNNDTCFKTDTSQRISMTQASVSSYKTSEEAIGRDELTFLATRPLMSSERTLFETMDGDTSRVGTTTNNNRIHINTISYRASSLNRPILNISGKRGQNDGGNDGFENMVNYQLFFAGRLGPPDGGTGEESIDHPVGVHHFTLGRDRGIVKNITLKKTQTPGLQEVRFEQQGYDGLAQLRVVYDVEIECFAHVKAFPGQYIFVNPQGFAPSTSLVPCSDDNLTKYGIGGYYMIISSEHSFASGEATTKITAKWVASVEGTEESCGTGGLINVRNCDS